MNSPVALLTRSRSGALVARPPLLLPCETCPDAALCDGTYPCPKSDPEEDLPMIDAYFFQPGDVYPTQVTFLSDEELIKWSIDHPKADVVSYNDLDSVYRNGVKSKLAAMAAEE
jgi:hypothetical protein